MKFSLVDRQGQLHGLCHWPGDAYPAVGTVLHGTEARPDLVVVAIQADHTEIFSGEQSVWDLGDLRVVCDPVHA